MKAQKGVEVCVCIYFFFNLDARCRWVVNASPLRQWKTATHIQTNKYQYN